jgi:hypothetical protein
MYVKDTTSVDDNKVPVSQVLKGVTYAKSLGECKNDGSNVSTSNEF